MRCQRCERWCPFITLVFSGNAYAIKPPWFIIICNLLFNVSYRCPIAIKPKPNLSQNLGPTECSPNCRKECHQSSSLSLHSPISFSYFSYTRGYRLRQLYVPISPSQYIYIRIKCMYNTWYCVCSIDGPQSFCHIEIKRVQTATHCNYDYAIWDDRFRYTQRYTVSYQIHIHTIHIIKCAIKCYSQCPLWCFVLLQSARPSVCRLSRPHIRIREGIQTTHSLWLG